MPVLLPALGRVLQPPLAGVTNNFGFPTFYWDFRSGLLHPSMAFTRASTGWVEQNGVLVQKAINTPRFWIDLNGNPWGFFAETQSTNAVTNSQALTGSGWTASAVTVTDNAVTSPDGTQNAATIKEDGTTASRYAAWAATGIVNNSVYGFSFFVKNISGSRWVQWEAASGAYYVNFNPSTGAIGTVGPQISNAVVRQFSNGWYRVSGFYTSPGTGGFGFGIHPVTASNSVGSPSYAGDNSSTIAVWGVQFETAGVGVTSYIPTAGAAVTRAADVLALPLTSLPGWNASKGGVLVAPYRLHTLRPGSISQPAVTIYDAGATYSNALVLADNYSAANRFLVFSNSGVDTLIGAAAPAAFARRKSAAGWSSSHNAIAHDGTLDNIDGGRALPVSLVTMGLGHDGTGVGLNGTIESIAYYAGARSDAFVRQVSR